MAHFRIHLAHFQQVQHYHSKLICQFYLQVILHWLVTLRTWHPLSQYFDLYEATHHLYGMVLVAYFAHSIPVLIFYFLRHSKLEHFYLWNHSDVSSEGYCPHLLFNEVWYGRDDHICHLDMTLVNVSQGWSQKLSGTHL